LDFTGAVFHGGDFRGAHFSHDNKVTFAGAKFWSGEVDFTKADFGGDFRRAEFSGGTVDFAFTTFGDEMDFTRAKFCGAKVDFTDAMFFTEHAGFDQTTFSDGSVLFGAHFSSTVDFKDAEFSGANVDFTEAKLGRGALIMLDSARVVNGAPRPKLPKSGRERLSLPPSWESDSIRANPDGG
jgi:uncharacterized protein YjbI with pentapeptide repeats